MVPVWAGTRVIAVAVLAVVGMVSSSLCAEESGRKTRSRVSPSYPELAKRMHLSGAVRVEVVVAPSGTVKATRVLGGHPVLANSAVEAVKKWRFEPGAEETVEIIEFKFAPQA